METLLQRMEEEGKVDRTFLHHIFPRLEVWFDWFNSTQVRRRRSNLFTPSLKSPILPFLLLLLLLYFLISFTLPPRQERGH